jgi:hypothetical protein
VGKEWKRDFSGSLSQSLSLFLLCSLPYMNYLGFCPFCCCPFFGGSGDRHSGTRENGKMVQHAGSGSPSLPLSHPIHTSTTYLGLVSSPLRSITLLSSFGSNLPVLSQALTSSSLSLARSRIALTALFYLAAWTSTGTLLSSFDERAAEPGRKDDVGSMFNIGRWFPKLHCHVNNRPELPPRSRTIIVRERKINRPVTTGRRWLVIGHGRMLFSRVHPIET